MERTLQTNKRELGKQTGYGRHSKQHAQTDASKEKGNGGHFVEKAKGKAIPPQGRNETRRQWRTLSMDTEANWGSKDDGKHSEHHAQADASKQKGKAEKAQGGKETQRNEDTLQRHKRGHPRQNPSL